MTPGQRLTGKVAIVTGSSRGIGRAIAAAYAAEGAAAVVAARTEQPEPTLPGTVHDTVDEIRAAGGEAIGVACDLTVEVDLVRLVDTAIDELGPIDVLVNNAAATIPGRPGRRPAATPPQGASAEARGISSIPLEAVRTQFEVNLLAPWRLIQLVLPAMRERGRGAIVNISSEAARMPGDGPYPGRGAPFPAAYGVSKLALEHLTRCVAFELTGAGIAVNALAPSRPVPTPGLAWVGGDARPMATPQSFAEAAVRLAVADPRTRSGQIWHSEDLLHPELGRRGWLAPRPDGSDHDS